MIIDIGPVKRLNKKIIKSATEYYANILISPRMQKNVSLEILHDEWCTDNRV